MATFEQREAQARDTLLAMSPEFEREIELLCSAPYTDPLLALRVIAEMGRDFNLRYPNKKAFSAGVGSAPEWLVSCGKLLHTDKRHGNQRLINHMTDRLKGLMIQPTFESAAMGRRAKAYRKRAGFSKALLAVAHDMTEAWFMVMKSGNRYNDTLLHPREEVHVKPKEGDGE